MKRTTYTAKFKSDRVLELLQGEDELGAIAAKHNISPNLTRLAVLRDDFSAFLVFSHYLPYFSIFSLPTWPRLRLRPAPSPV